MGNLAILLPLDSDEASLSGGDWATDLALLQDMQPTRAVQSNGLSTSQTRIDVDFGAAIAADAVVFGRTNLSADATIEIWGAASLAELDSSPTTHVDADSVWPSSGRPEDRGLTWRDVFKRFTSATERAWRFEIDDPYNADGFLSLGRFYLGPLWQPRYNYSYGWERGRTSLDIRVDTPGGHTLTDRRAAGPRVWTLPMNFIDRDDADDFLDELDRLMGTAKDLFVCLDPDETTRLHRKMMMATMPEVPPRAQPLFEIFRTTLKFKELR